MSSDGRQVLRQSITTMGAVVPSDSSATGTVSTVAGSESETGTIQILTRSTDQTSEQYLTPSGFTRVYSRGRASVTSGSALSTLQVESALAAQCPYFPLPMLAGALSNPDLRFTNVGLETVDGVAVTHLKFWNTFASIPDLQGLSELSARDVWLDASSALPQRISFIRRSADGASISVDVWFSDYRTVDGVLYPFSIRVSLNGTQWAAISIQNVTFNNGLDDSRFPVQ